MNHQLQKFTAHIHHENGYSTYWSGNSTVLHVYKVKGRNMESSNKIWTKDTVLL